MMKQSLPWTRVVNACAIACLALALLTIWAPLVPPSQDGASHMLDVVVHSSPELFDSYVRTHTPPSARGFVVPSLLVAPVAGPVGAARVTLTFCLLMWAGGMVLLTRRPLGEAGPAVIGASMVCAGWIVAMGFWNFFVGLSLGVLALGVWWRWREAGWASRIVAALLLLLAVPAHVAAASLMACVLAAFSVCTLVWPSRSSMDTAPPTFRQRGLGVMGDVACWLPVLLWSALIVRGLSSDLEVWTSRSASLEWTRVPLVDGLRNLLMCAFVSWSRFAALAQGTALVVLVTQLFRHPRGAETLMVAGCLLVAAATVVLPLHLAGWGYASVRLLTPALVLPLAFVRMDGRLAKGLVSAFSAIAVVSMILTLGGALREGERAAHAIDAFSPAPSGRAFVVVYHPEPLVPAAPYVQSMIGIGNWGVFGGGTHAGQFAVVPGQHNALFVADPAVLFPATPLLFFNVPAACLEDPACAAQEALRADRVATSAVEWDTLLVSEAPRGFLDQLTLRGFTPTTRGTWAPPEPASVRLTGARDGIGAGPDDVIVIRASYPSTIGLFRAAFYRPTDPDWVLEGLPSGAVMVDAFIDRDGDRRPGPGDAELLAPTQRVLVAGSEAEIPLPAR